MIDQYNRKIEYVRISVTDRCNLRCQYCMPESGVSKMKHEDILTLEEILTIVKSLASLGIRKVRLTGGEPLLRKGIISLIHNIKSIDGIEQVMLTTNGVLLNKMVDDLICAGLDGINLSIDTLNAKTFEKITRRNLFDDVQSALNKIINSKLILKINCVPIAGFNQSEILNLVELTKNHEIKLRFIELMPIGCAVDFKGIPTINIRKQIENAYGDLIPMPTNELQGPAKYFGLSGFAGQIGFIDAIDHKFCSSCNRIRLTSDGFLKLCLNSNAGLDIKSLLRTGANDSDLTDNIKQAIYNKPKEHHFNESIDKTQMYQVGG